MIRYLAVQVGMLQHWNEHPPLTVTTSIGSDSRSATMWHRTRTSPPPCRKPRCFTCRSRQSKNNANQCMSNSQFVAVQTEYWLEMLSEFPWCRSFWRLSRSGDLWVCVFAKILLLILLFASTHVTSNTNPQMHFLTTCISLVEAAITTELQSIGFQQCKTCPPNLSICFCIESGWIKVFQGSHTNQGSFQLLNVIYRSKRVAHFNCYWVVSIDKLQTQRKTHSFRTGCFLPCLHF